MKLLTPATERLVAPISLSSSDRLSLSLDNDGIRFIAKIHAGDGFQPSFQACSIFTKRIPEHKHVHTDEWPFTWLFAATDTTALIINAIWKPEQIEFVDVHAETMYKHLLLRYAAQDRNVELQADFRSGAQIETPPWFVDNPPESKLQLVPYQRVAAIAAMQSFGYALFMPPGTGKTPITVNVMCNEARRLQADRMYRALIVCPCNVRMNWSREIDRFSTVPHITTVLRGNKIKRTRELVYAMLANSDEQMTAVIVSYELMVRMIDALCGIEWDLVAVDESHSIATPSTLRTKKALQLRENARKRMVLTGTPIRNSTLDLFAQLEFLGKGCSGFIGWENFKQFYGVWRPTEYGEVLEGVQNLPFMQERLLRSAFMISKKEALPDLPDKTYDIIEITMSDEQIEAYKQLSKELIYEIEVEIQNAVTPKQRAMAVSNILTKMLRLSHITSGFYTLDEVLDLDGTVVIPKEVRYFPNNPKLEALVELLHEKGPNEKTIIWSVWVPSIQLLSARLKHEGIKHVLYYGQVSHRMREAAEYDFNHDPETKVMIGNPGAGGVGLNLIGYPPGRPDEFDTNANHAMYYDQDWSFVKREQSEDRLHRKGTREPVRVTDLCCPQTIDEEIRARVVEKKTLSFEITDIKQIIHSIMSGELKDG